MNETPPDNREDIPSAADMRRALENAADAEELKNRRYVVCEAIRRLTGVIADIDVVLQDDTVSAMVKDIRRADQNALIEDREQFRQLIHDFPESSA